MKARPLAASALRAEINVTPLVDVCLVLLIIFMVVTPMLKSTPIALPETARPEAMPESGGELSITMGEDAAIHVGSRQVAERAGIAHPQAARCQPRGVSRNQLTGGLVAGLSNAELVSEDAWQPSDPDG